jgi:sugar/nucleoside kinase (ribokinase family)
VRRELANGSDLGAFFDFVLERCDLLLPGQTELSLRGGGASEEAAIEALLARGVSAIVVKRGVSGASYYDHSSVAHARAPPVKEVDPTGAEDCFGATFVVCRLRGMPVEECLRYANANGARTVTLKGPMEGAATFVEPDAWLAERANG